MRSWIIAAGIILLAACSPAAGPTDLPFYTATPPVLQPLPYPNLTDSPAAFPELSGGNPQLVPSSSAFQFTVSGDVEATATTGTIVYNFIPAAGALSARDKIFITASDASASQQVAFEFSPGVPPGTYPLGSAPQWMPGLLTAQYMRLSDDGSGETRIQSYNQNVSGTLTLTKTGETISGVFEFSAQWITSSVSGETVSRTVTVGGAFDNVTYSQMSDPFDTTQPILERATPPPLVGSE